jgi:hypothetical protein
VRKHYNFGVQNQSEKKEVLPMKRLLAVGGLIGVMLVTGCISNFKARDGLSSSTVGQDVALMNENQASSEAIDNLKNTVQALNSVRTCVEAGTCAVDINSIEQNFKQVIAYTREIAKQLKASAALATIQQILRSNLKKYKINKTFKDPEFLKVLQNFGFSEDDIKDMKKLLKKNEKLIRLDIQMVDSVKLLEDTADAMENRLKSTQLNFSVEPSWEWYRRYIAPEVRWFSSCIRSYAWTGVGAFLYGVTLGSAIVNPNTVNFAGSIYGARGIIQNTRETIKICTGY